MQSRAARFTVVALLLAVGAGAAAFTWWAAQRLSAEASAATDAGVHLDRLTAAIGSLGAAQAGYVAPGQPYGQWQERVDALLQQIAAESDALRPLARSAGGAAAMQALINDVDRFAEADTRARDSLRLEDPLSAADAIFNDGHETLGMMAASLRDLRSAEAVALTSRRAALEQQLLLTLGAAAALWALGLLLLARAPRIAPAESVSTLDVRGAAHAGQEPAAQDAVRRAHPAAAIGAVTPGRAAVDLAAAADLCTDISRLANAAGLPDLLARAAVVLDASGIIVWVSAGDELFAVTAHGYDPRVISAAWLDRAISRQRHRERVAQRRAAHGPRRLDEQRRDRRADVRARQLHRRARH